MNSLRSAVQRILELEFFIVSALTAAAMVSDRLLLPAVVISAFFWPLRRWAAGRWTVRTPLDVPAAALLLFLPLNFWISSLPGTSLVQALRLANGLALFYALANWADTTPRLRLAAWGFLAAGVLLAGFAFISVDWTQSKFPFLPPTFYAPLAVRVQDSVHPNVLAGALLLFAPLMFAWLLWNSFGSIKSWLLTAGAILFITGILVFTQSRGALLAFGVSALATFAMRWRWGWLIIPASGLAAGWAVYAYGVPAFVDLVFGSRVLGGLEGRVEIWGRAIFMLQDFPITGTGLGVYPEAVTHLYPVFTESTRIDHAHNLFLQVGADMGIPGLVAFLAAYGLALRSAYRAYRTGVRMGSRFMTGLGAGLAAVQIAIGVHGLLDAVVWGQVRTAPLLWLTWGFSAAAHLVATRGGKRKQ